MNDLKLLLAKKREAAQAIKTGGKKFVKHSVIDDARLKCLREEEEQERLAKVRLTSFQQNILPCL